MTHMRSRLGQYKSKSHEPSAAPTFPEKFMDAALERLKEQRLWREIAIKLGMQFDFSFSIECDRDALSALNKWCR